MKYKLSRIGFIAKAYGFKGELKCTLEVDSISDKLPPYLWLYLEGKPVPFCVENINFHNNSLILKFEDIDTENQAQKLKTTNLYCETSIFENYFEKQESLDDLIGFKVIDQTKGNIGIVDSILENNIQPTLVLLLNKKEILIPYSEEIILAIDENQNTISINAPEGLIDLYLE